MEKQRAKVDGGLCDWALADGVVCQDVACEKCGYSLKTLAVEARCPECGEAVAGSVRAVRLCFADIDWMKRVRWGARLPPVALLWWIAAVIGLSAAVGMIGGANFEFGIVMLGALPAITMIMLGVFLATQAQGPVGRVFVGLTRYGLLARVAIVVWVGCAGVMLVTAGWVTGEGLPYWVVVTLPTVMMATFCIAVVGVMMHLREIGLVAGSVGLRVRCWLTVGCVVLGWGVAGVGSVLFWVGVRETGWVGTVMAIAILVAIAVGFLAVVGALVSASGVMGRQIALARRVRGVG